MKTGIITIVAAALLSCGGGRVDTHANVYDDSLHIDTPKRVRLLFAGDMMQHAEQIKSARQADGHYDYSHCFELITSRIAAADIAVCNFEAPLGGEPYAGYPCFSSPDEYAEAVRNAGFDIFLTSNNHCLDKGAKGLARTIDELDKLHIPHLGTYLSPAERDSLTPFIIESNGIRVALLNYTYGTNGITVKPPYTVNYIDTVQIRGDIARTRLAEPDIIIACLHWGNEYQLQPSSHQRKLAEWLYKNGVRYIIGSHPHVVQPMEFIPNNDTKREQLVVYSLGNTISNMSATDTDGGALFEMTLQKDSTTHIIGCGYGLVWTDRPYLSGKRYYRLIPSDYPADSLSTASRYRFNRYIKATRTFFEKNNKNIFPINSL